MAGLLTRALTDGTGGWEPLRATSGGVPVLLLCGYVVVLGSIAPFLLVAGALRHLPATSVGILGMVEPVIAATVAWITLGAGEALNVAQLGGGLLVLAGVALAETARLAEPPATPAVTARRCGGGAALTGARPRSLAGSCLDSRPLRQKAVL